MVWEEIFHELTVFYGEDGAKVCADAATVERNKAVSAEVQKAADRMFAAGESIWKVKAESYRIIGREMRGHIFKGVPFYCEFGLNGGWGAEKNSPGRVIAKTALERKKLFEKIPPDTYDALRDAGFFLCCGPYYDALHHSPPQSNILKHGFRYYYERVCRDLRKAEDPEVRGFLEAAREGLEALHSIQLRFAEDAARMLKSAAAPVERRNLSMIAESAAYAPWEAPRSFYEGLNSLWFCREIFGVLDGLASNNLGRPDAMLEDLYEKDLAEGRLTAESAQELIDMFLLVGDAHNSHDLSCSGAIDHEMEISLTLGGCDAEGKTVFNALTRMFLDSYRRRNFIYPKPHCRFSAESPDEYLLQITGHIAEGCGIYSLVNDDGVIPALTASGHSLADAREYNCAGCWDLVVESREDNGNGNYFYMDKVLEATFHKPEEYSAKTGLLFLPLDHAVSFRNAYDILLGNLKQVLRTVCGIQGINGAATWRKTWPTPLYSACMTGCLESGKDYSQGGCRYNPRAMSFLFFANVVDSLLTIEQGCFRKKLFTLPELLKAVRADYKGFERMRKQILSLPHWGDNSPESTRMGRRVFRDLAETLRGIPNERGGNFYPGIWSYREFFFYGKNTDATPDGRYAGEPMAQSLNPSHFRNNEDPTTVLLALSKLDLRHAAGNSVVNLMMEKENFPPEVQLGILKAAAELKLQLLQINCASTADLRDAQKHPERYPNLIIRLCGFSVKFVSLSPQWQDEVIKRRRY